MTVPRRQLFHATCSGRRGHRTTGHLHKQAHGMYAISPETGIVLWENKCFPLRTVASPVYAGNLLIGTCGSGGGGSNLLVAIKPPATQDASVKLSTRYLVAQHPTFQHRCFLKGVFISGRQRCRNVCSCIKWRNHLEGTRRRELLGVSNTDRRQYS